MAVATWVVMPKTRSYNPSNLFRSILCPIDFSEPSAVALRYAASLARHTGARLHVFYANHPMLVAAAATALGDRDYATTTLAELRRFVGRAIPASVRRGVPISYATKTGETSKMIELAAREFRCELIVMGTQGLGGIQKVIVGSTTERMLRRAALPVLAIPPSFATESAAVAPPRLRAATTILIPVDLREQSARDVRAGERIARALGRGLLLLHVLPPIQAPPWFRADFTATARLEATKAGRQLESLARSVGSGVRVDTRVARGKAADEVAALAAEEGIGLVVMRRRRGPGVLGSRAGSIASRVLRHAVTPVLVLPDRPAKRLQAPRERLRASA